MMKKKIGCFLMFLAATVGMSVSAYAASTSEALSSSKVQEILEESFSLRLNPPSDYLTGEYVDPMTGSLSLSEDVLYLPGKNGLDVKLKLSYNSREKGSVYTSGSTSYENIFVRESFYYDYTDEDGETKSVLIFFKTEYDMLETAPESFTASALPDVQKDYNGDKYYWINDFKLSDEGIVFVRNTELKPYCLEFCGKTKMEYTEFDAEITKTAQIWQWDMPKIVHEVHPSLTKTVDNTKLYDLYTAFVDLDGEYRQMRFSYDYDTKKKEVTYSSADVFGSEDFECLEWIPKEDITDEERNITYHCKIRDAKGRTMYFAKKGYIVAAEDRFGNMIKYDYEKNKIVKITDTLGRVIRFEYDENDVYIYLASDGETEKMYAKITYEKENDDLLDPNDYLVSDDRYTSCIVYFDNEKEYVKRFDYKKWHTLYQGSSLVFHYEPQLQPIVTEICYPNGLESVFSYEKKKTYEGVKKEDYFVVRRCDIDNGEEMNAYTYNYTKVKSESSTSVTTEKIREEDESCETYSGNGSVEKKITDYGEDKLTETYTYETSRGRKKLRLTTQKYKSGKTSGTERKVATTYSNFRPSAVTYDDYSEKTLYHGNSAFVESLAIKQSDDVYVKTSYTLSEQEDDYYAGRVIESATLSESRDGGKTYDEKYRTDYTYNSDGTPKSEIVNGDNVIKKVLYDYVYGDDGSVTTRVTVTDLYDADGNRTEDIVNETKKDFFGRVIYSKDGNGNETRYEYDFLGRVTKVENPDGTNVTYEYDTKNRTTTVTDENGVMMKNVLLMMNLIF